MAACMLSHEVAAVSLWVGGDQPDLSLAAAERIGGYLATLR